MYSLPSSDRIKNHIAACCDNRPPPEEVINNVYELPNIEPAIRYLHIAAGFPTKATWLKAIRKVSYLSWPLVNVKNVSKYFPDSDKIQSPCSTPCRMSRLTPSSSIAHPDWNPSIQCTPSPSVIA